METTQRNAIWRSIALGLVICPLCLALPSCSEEDDLLNDASYKALTVDGIAYYGPEIFTTTSKDPLVVTQTLTNLDFKYLENFVIKVQNGSKKTKCKSIEVKIDGVVVISSADFKRTVNPVIKSLSGLTDQSEIDITITDAKEGYFIELLIEGTLQAGVISDIEGNYYHTVQIGDQLWLAENLRTTKLNDGTPIIQSTIYSDWVTYIFEAPCFCWYNNDSLYKAVYGALYNNESARNDKLCPVGWHVSTETDWYNMVLFYDPNVVNYYGYMSDIAGGVLKATGTIEGGDGLWHEPNSGATNESGFSAIPGGYRRDSFFDLGYEGHWWMIGGLDFRTVSYQHTIIGGSEGSNESGRSIRCVKDYLPQP